eukprot:Nitzschia sp. Nitz4//scaffold196_size54656//50406//51821//NITZ4_006649-RA/size54656-processed-gene-0.56-mRNA-1//1//CDS//3329540456//865//frame0
MKKRINIWRMGVVMAATSSLAWTLHATFSQKWFPLIASSGTVEPKIELGSQFVYITNASDMLLPKESCKTYCPHGFFQNRIVYQYYHQAGLLDRLSIITKLANVAASLCAHVLFPTPNQLLSEPHNNGTATDPKFVWKDFVQLTFMENPSIELLTESSEPAGSEHFKTVFTTDSVDQVEAHWQMARKHTYVNDAGNLSARNFTGFQWIFTFSLYEFVEPLNQAMNAEIWNSQQQQRSQRTSALLENTRNPCPHLKDTVAPRCVYAKQTLTPELRQLAQDLLKPPHEQVRRWQATNFSNPKVLYYLDQVQHVQQALDSHWMIGLHVRRGDSASRCDTSLEKMERYLRCSIADHLPQNSGSDRTGATSDKNNATVFFYSDERDEGYRSSLATSAREKLRLGFVDLDMFVSGALSSMDSDKMPDWKRSNNYYFFRVLHAIVEALGLDLSLEQRREISCETCSEAFASMLRNNRR